MTTWAKVAETYNISYKNQLVTSSDGLQFELERSRGFPGPASNLTSIGPGIRDHINENFLKVKGQWSINPTTSTLHLLELNGLALKWANKTNSSIIAMI